MAVRNGVIPLSDWCIVWLVMGLSFLLAKLAGKGRGRNEVQSCY